MTTRLPGILACGLLVSGAAAQQHERSRLLPGDPGPGAGFGRAVAMQGGIAVIGASGDTQSGESSGAAYVFDVSAPASPVELAKIAPDDGQASDRFGDAVSLRDGLALIGAPDAAGREPYAGVAYVFDLADPSNPVQIAKLLASDGGGGDGFGQAVALGGGVAAVGAPFNEDHNDWSGKAYLFDLSDPAAPVEVAVLWKSDWWGWFGAATAILDTTAIVGSPGARQTGRVYLFDVVTGAQIAEIAPRGDDLLGFGDALAVSGSTLLVGAPWSSLHGAQSGAALLFDLSDPDAPRQAARFSASDGSPDAAFGLAVAVDGATALVGAPRDGDAGSVYVFDLTNPGTPLEIGKLRPRDQGAGDYFGHAVALEGSVALAGSPEGDLGATDSGAAYLFQPVPCPADLSGDGASDTLDVVLFLAAWNLREPVSDWNEDGLIDSRDVIAFLNSWAWGC